MNLRTSRNQVKAEANMASISDLVFLLLIFFIILSTMVTPGVPIDPPSAKSSIMEAGKPLSVTIQKDNTFYIGDQKVSKEELETMLISEFSKMDKDARAFVLRVDKDVASEHTVYVLDIANKNGWKVGIATKN